MHRRDLLTAMGASAFAASTSGMAPASNENSVLELKTWFLHNSAENQGKRLATYLKNGYQPAVKRAGVHLGGVFTNVFAASGPFLLTVSEYADWASFGAARAKIAADTEHQKALDELGAGDGAPFVRVESSLFRSFDVMPKMAGVAPGKKFVELRTYESPSFSALQRKVRMFNEGEAKIFERLGHAPVFFGECLAGPRQPNLSYMLAYESLAARDQLWDRFVSDPEWKALSSPPDVQDAQLVANISNIILQVRAL